MDCVLLLYEGGECITEGLRSYLTALVGVSLISAAVLSLIPKGSVKRAAGLTCGLILAITAIQPITTIQDFTLAQAISRVWMQTESARTGIEVKNRELVSAIIKQKSETYILDKADKMGLKLTAEVTVKDDGVYPYPSGAVLTGRYTDLQQEELERYITNETGIPPEAQIWKRTE